MSASNSTITPNNIMLSPCRVTYKGVDLGATQGNVAVKVQENLADIKSDQLGSTAIDKIVSGFQATVETELAETLLKDNWNVVFPAHKLVNNGGQKMFYFDSQVAQALSAFAGALILHPLNKADTDLSGDIKIYKAVAEGKIDFDYSASKQAGLKIVWHVLPDFTTTPPRFLVFGDPTIGVVNASAGSATAGTGNTGNGTVGSIAAHNTGTQTELITLTCLQGGATGKFSVSGSLSGPLGIATVGTGFTSTAIDLTISDGGTHFVANDSFTISTTAANYT